MAKPLGAIDRAIDVYDVAINPSYNTVAKVGTSAVGGLWGAIGVIGTTLLFTAALPAGALGATTAGLIVIARSVGMVAGVVVGSDVIGDALYDEIRSDRANSTNGSTHDPSGECSDEKGLDAANANEAQTPIVLDMNGDGVKLTSLQQSSAMFDIDNDGFAELTAWVSPDDALLVLDRNSNGVIDNQSELFGNTALYSNGFQTLATLDTNSDGVITNADTEFSNLEIWQDSDSDGFSSADELSTLNEAGISAISLADVASSQTLEGNRVLRASTFTINGETREALDVLFNVNQSISSYLLDEDFVYDPEVFALPQLRGFGDAKDLWVAMTEDSTLKTMVRDLVDADYSNFDYDTLRSNVENILFRWTGTDDYEDYHYGEHINGQVARASEVWLGIDTRDSDFFNAAPILSNNQAKHIVNEWNNLVDHVAAQFIVDIANQPLYDAIQDAVAIYRDLLDNNVDVDSFSDEQWDNALSPAFSGTAAALDTHPLAFLKTEISYNFTSNRLVGDFEAFVNNIATNQPLDASEKAAYWSNYLPVINAVADSQLLSDEAFADALQETYLGDAYGNISLLRNQKIFEGNESAEHLTGTDGDDIIFGSNVTYTHNAPDTLEGGKGNDRLEDSGGDDTYVYYRGDGDDVINDHSGDGDTLVLNNISINDVTFTQSEYDQYFQDQRELFSNDITINIDGGGSILLENYRLAGESNVIETIQFSDGTLSAQDIMSLSYQAAITDGNDSYSDIFSSNTIAEHVDASKGNDIIRLYEGLNVLHYEYGDGIDMLYGGASDTISFGSGIRYEDLNIYSIGDDLIFSIDESNAIYHKNYTENTLTSIKFSDGSVKTMLDIQQDKLSPNVPDTGGYIGIHRSIADIQTPFQGSAGNDLFHITKYDGHMKSTQIMVRICCLLIALATTSSHSTA